MITNIKARINRALLQGLNVNQFAAKMQAYKGALRSLIFKQWHKLVKQFKNNAVIITASKLSASLFVVVNNTTSVTGAKVLMPGRMLSLQHFEAFQRVYSFNLLIVQ
jgi:hypothetical protein